ncbi:MAG: response regulator [Cyanobacteria bacterium J083]|nr:MAG: response regulator [Cyanobacteria bacterium J083]
MLHSNSSKPLADILVIDDTPENLALLSQMLTERSYKVRSVTKGSTALRAAQAVPPDLILLDVNMPEMNGYQVCTALKANKKTKDIPVIFISALGDVLDKVRAFQVGGVDYITKPFQVEEVLARLQTHLTLRRLQQQLTEQNTQLQEQINQRTAAQTKFTKAFRSSPNPIAILTLAEGRFVEVNPSFVRMSGYSTEELLNCSLEQVNLGFNSEKYESALQTLLDKGVLHNQEIEFKTKSQNTKIVLLSMELIDLDGIPCTLNLINDITEHKRLENEFISIVSHELRTPMTSLMGALDLLNSGKLGDLTKQGKRVLEIALTNTERLVRLVNDILDLERMKSGKITMHKTECNARDLLEAAVQEMQAMADSATVKLLVETVEAKIWADADRLQQTLTNLLSNGIKFSEPNSSIWLKARTESDMLHIEVQDQGRGIPADKLQSIFERFQQVDASDSRKKGGTGLGLAICRNIITQHDGKIWVESALGEGSTFHIKLPLAQDKMSGLKLSEGRNK